jgi:hypothetical protein
MNNNRGSLKKKKSKRHQPVLTEAIAHLKIKSKGKQVK